MDLDNLGGSKDPFADDFDALALDDGEKKKKKKSSKKKDEEVGDASSGDLIHIRVQQRNGRKCITTVQGLNQELDLQKILKALKKANNCNGTVVADDEMGDVLQLQGDQRKAVADFLTKNGARARAAAVPLPLLPEADAPLGPPCPRSNRDRPCGQDQDARRGLTCYTHAHDRPARGARQGGGEREPRDGQPAVRGSREVASCARLVATSSSGEGQRGCAPLTRQRRHESATHERRRSEVHRCSDEHAVYRTILRAASFRCVFITSCLRRYCRLDRSENEKQNVSSRTGHGVTERARTPTVSGVRAARA